MNKNKITIRQGSLEFVREPLTAPFGFKGRHLDELWQVVVSLTSDNAKAYYPGVQSVLWSDAEVFAGNPPASSNAMMMLVTNRALKILEGVSYYSPMELTTYLKQNLTDYANNICGKAVAETFVKNALVGVDYALWALYAKENNIDSFDGIIPDIAIPALSHRHKKLAHIPLISYAVTQEQIKDILDKGNFLLKIKIGHSSGKASTLEEDMRDMVEWDKNRLSQIHEIAKNYHTEYTDTGKVLYYLDANGRYDSKDRLTQLLDYAQGINALDQIVLLEEPFDQSAEIDVGDLPVAITADESAHGVEDVQKRISMGYKAIALKPIAKTMSVSFEMAAVAQEYGVGCLCADLTVNPLLAELNKQFSARIASLPGMKVGCVEINGDQNYQNWDYLKTLLPQGVEYSEGSDGVFELDGYFYKDSGLLFNENGYSKYFNK